MRKKRRTLLWRSSLPFDRRGFQSGISGLETEQCALLSKNKRKHLGIADFVKLDGWRDDVSSCLQGLDVFVMPSNFEGMPLALLEAMAAGLCCCVSDVDGMAEAIEHGFNGYLCAPGNIQKLVRTT